MRLQRFIAMCGVCSRRAAEEFIRAGRVTVNGTPVTEQGVKINPASDRVVVDRRVIRPSKKRLYLFHKPRGIVTTLDDPHNRENIARFTRMLAEKVFPVGRLDRDVSGLLLLTNDGDFAQAMLHPRYQVGRVYWAVVRGVPGPETIARLCAGVTLRDGKASAFRVCRLSRSAKRVSVVGEIPADCSLLEIEVREGRKHFVKRLLAHVGHPVVRLSRVQFGEFELGDLAVGGLREVPVARTEMRSTGGESEAKNLVRTKVRSSRKRIAATARHGA